MACYDLFIYVDAARGGVSAGVADSPGPTRTRAQPICHLKLFLWFSCVNTDTWNGEKLATPRFTTLLLLIQ